MSFSSARFSLLLAALTASLFLLTSGVPLTQSLDVIRDQPVLFAYEADAVPVEAAHKNHHIPRSKHDISSLLFGATTKENIKNVFVRVNIPKPPPPPPPPLPRPVPAPIPKGPAPKPNPIAPAPRPKTPPRPDPPKPDPAAKPIPPSENPGQGPGKGDEPKAMDSYQRAGVAQLGMYETTARGNKADTPIVQTQQELAKYGKNEAFLDFRKNSAYKIDKQSVRLDDSVDLKVVKNFRSTELGFDSKSVRGMTQISVYVEKSSGSPIMRGTYDHEGGFIVYQTAFKKDNKVPGATPLNEMSMQSFISAAGDKTKNLKAVFLMDVQNKEFWAITRQNYNDLKQPFTQVLTFQRNTPQFDRYMGSPNMNSKLYSFANHHNAIGNKIPTSIIVIPKQAENSGNKLTAAVIFKDPEP